jgi:hypothetical protein
VPERERAEETEREPLSVAAAMESLRELAPLVAGAGLLVYVLGGAVLYARFSLADLPEKTVIGYLPRDFLMTVGITEVLLPGALAAAAHAAWRLFGPRRERPLAGRAIAAAAAAWTVGVIVAIVLVAHWNGEEGADHTHVDEPAFWIVGLGACAAAVGGAALVRWRLQIRPLRVHLGAPWVPHTIVYGVAAMIVAAVAATTVALPHARVCFSDGTGQSGTFIGESEDRVFLGEDIPRRPRITLIASDDVDRMFIGHDARSAECG